LLTNLVSFNFRGLTSFTGYRIGDNSQNDIPKNDVSQNDFLIVDDATKQLGGPFDNDRLAERQSE
jgi:hypothetical protein